MKTVKYILVFLLISTINIYAQRGAYKTETEAIKAERTGWYTQARFGMFIHWGAYSVLNGEYKGKKQIDPKGEWVMNHLKIPVQEYRDSVVSRFNPIDFDAEEWVLAAKNAGMKYMVITTKHHDGFALFHSKVSDYNIVDATPFKRDVIKELSDACRKHGLRFGICYSQAQDWYHPGGYKPDSRWDKQQNGDWTEYFQTTVKGQVTELLTNYGEISLLWWDSGRAVQDKNVADKVGSELVKLQPNIIVNPRLGGNLKGDFNTYEQLIPAVFKNDYNELCLTHNRSWSYKESDNNWKTKPQFDYIPQISGDKGDEYIDMWKNNFPHPRFVNTGNAAHWKIDVTQGGKYTVKVVVSTNSDKNIVSIQGKYHHFYRKRKK